MGIEDKIRLLIEKSESDNSIAKPKWPYEISEEEANFRKRVRMFLEESNLRELIEQGIEVLHAQTGRNGRIQEREPIVPWGYRFEYFVQLSKGSAYWETGFGVFYLKQFDKLGRRSHSGFFVRRGKRARYGDPAKSYEHESKFPVETLFDKEKLESIVASVLTNPDPTYHHISREHGSADRG